ncbi:MAG: hypothetical protein IJB08_05295 [Alistipes sp.]|nr:hypothetical protein [Alistipes sp.]
MKLSEKIILALRHTFDTALYFAVMAVKENFRDYVGRAGRGAASHERVAILGNGPSLARELPTLLERKCEYDFMAVNFFAEDERFVELKPAFYLLSDPMFFRATAMQSRVDALYRLLTERVTWPMTLYVQYYNPEHFDYRAALPNENIRIVPFHTTLYEGFPSVRRWLFRRGLGSANYGTVVQVGEYIALRLGYRRLELYGVDHTLLDGLVVDADNRLCRRDSHYYDTTPAEPKPIMKKVPAEPYTMAEYLAETAQLFRGHEILRDYADSLGAEIINCTAGSMIDAYKKHQSTK